MTKSEAADILIEAADGLTDKEWRSRRAKKRRDALIEGDAMMIRSMHLTAVPKGEKSSKDIAEAVKVLSEGAGPRTQLIERWDDAAGRIVTEEMVIG